MPILSNAVDSVEDLLHNFSVYSLLFDRVIISQTVLLLLQRRDSTRRYLIGKSITVPYYLYQPVPDS